MTDPNPHTPQPSDAAPPYDRQSYGQQNQYPQMPPQGAGDGPDATGGQPGQSSQYGQNQYGQNQYGQNQYGQYDRNQSGQPDQYGQNQYGQNQSDQSGQSGQPGQSGQSGQSGQPDQYGQYGTPAYNQTSQPYGNPYGSQYGGQYDGQYGGNPYGGQYAAYGQAYGTPTLDQPYYGCPLPEAFLRFWKKYATFSGRASRSEFWWWMLCAVVIDFLLGMIEGDSSLLTTIWSVVTIVPTIALGVRRLHDTNRRGTFLAVYYVVMVLALVFILISGGVTLVGALGATGYGAGAASLLGGGLILMAVCALAAIGFGIAYIVLMAMPSNPAGVRFDKDHQAYQGYPGYPGYPGNAGYPGDPGTYAGAYPNDPGYQG